MENSEFRISNSEKAGFSGKGMFIAFLLIMLMLSGGADAQVERPARAVKAFQKATEAFGTGDWAGCEKELLKAIGADSVYTDALIMLGDVYLELQRPEQAADQYRKAAGLDPDKPYIVNSLLANTLFDLERYAEACHHFQVVMDDGAAPPSLKQAVSARIRQCRARQQLLESPVDFHPVNAGAGINSPEDEYVNAISADGQRLYFTRRVTADRSQNKEFNENFYASDYDGQWMEAYRLSFPPGTENDAGGMCISPDERLMFFTACFRRDSYGSCDLYYSERSGGAWSVARNMGAHINSDHWDAQPSISPDGKTLYFASNRKGGYGSSDIWKTERTPDGGWSKPANLGPVINTAQAEMAPFIHHDNNTLYFSSGGHPGMGGMDLFLTTRDGPGWHEPQNLGYPLNTSADELIVLISPDARKGFFSVNSLEGEGGFDIFEFEVYPEIMPVPVTYFKGRVIDSETGLPLEARFELADIGRDSLIAGAYSDPHNGEFLLCLPLRRDYLLNVSRTGYLFYSDHFSLEQHTTGTDPYIKDILMEPVSEGSTMVLRNVFYETDRYDLLPESYIELDLLVGFLMKNPALRVEIGGHTDDQGTEEYNQALSAKRAENVFRYLTLNNIPESRLTYAGYGESMPVAPNDTEEGRALNRRTEIKVLEIKK